MQSLQLDEAVDVYHQWIDECEEMAGSAAVAELSQLRGNGFHRCQGEGSAIATSGQEADEGTRLMDPPYSLAPAELTRQRQPGQMLEVELNSFILK